MAFVFCFFAHHPSFIRGTPGLSESCIHCDAAETGFYTQWWTVSSILTLLAPEYVVHHTDAIHRWIILFVLSIEPCLRALGSLRPALGPPDRDKSLLISAKYRTMVSSW